MPHGRETRAAGPGRSWPASVSSSTSRAAAAVRFRPGSGSTVTAMRPHVPTPDREPAVGRGPHQLLAAVEAHPDERAVARHPAPPGVEHHGVDVGRLVERDA